MSSSILSKSKARVQSPVTNTDSKSDCEVSSSSTSSVLPTEENIGLTCVPVESVPFYQISRLKSKSSENKMSSESTSRNPLVESANNSNRKSNGENEIKLTRTSATVQNEANNNNNAMIKLRTRPAKTSTSPTLISPCVWCSDNTTILKFILPTAGGAGENLRFCSEMCIAGMYRFV